MDALSDVLHAVKLDGAVFLAAEFRAPWSLSADGELLRQLVPTVEHFINYHYVSDGRCHAQAAGLDPVEVRAGEVIVFPHGDSHVMGSEPLLAPASMASLLAGASTGLQALAERPARLTYGGEGPPTHIVCGFLACDPRLCRPILAALPRMMTVNLRDGPSGRWIDESIRHSLDEAASSRAGSGAVLARLSEALFVETLRSYIERLPPSQPGWLAGLREPVVGRSLALLHRDASRAWTVEDLAREVGCSRSVLAERFAHYVGEPPMRYLARWRLGTAAAALRAGNARVGQIAQDVGYASEAAFNRAFKKEYGAAPHRWRRETAPADRPGAVRKPRPG